MLQKEKEGSMFKRIFLIIAISFSVVANAGATADTSEDLAIENTPQISKWEYEQIDIFDTWSRTVGTQGKCDIKKLVEATRTEIYISKDTGSMRLQQVVFVPTAYNTESSLFELHFGLLNKFEQMVFIEFRELCGFPDSFTIIDEY
jgi:hypothetical protein